MANRKRKKVQRYEILTQLKGCIRGKGMTYREVAQEMNIGINTLSDKLNGFYPFTVAEMEQLADLLGIAPEDVVHFFMPGYCKMQQSG